jgi:putative component of membrane protein insertase Oxa1/YidC/SpoIIIJ protein YidD
VPNTIRAMTTIGGRSSTVAKSLLVLAILTLLISPAYPAEDLAPQSGDGPDESQPAGGAPFWGLPLRWMVRFYQLTVGRVKYSSCPMEPSCSNFGIQALNHHPPHIAALMIGDRLHRCGHDLHYYTPVVMDERIKFLDPVDQEKFTFKTTSHEGMRSGQ